MKIQKTCGNEVENQYFIDFISEKRREKLSERTIDGYVSAYKLLASKTDGSLTPQNINVIIDYFTERGSDRSINVFLSSIRVFVNWCINNNYIEPFKIKLIKQQDPPIKFYTEENCRKLLEQPSKRANFREWRTYASVCFMLATGCRLGTIRNIELSDLDFENMEVVYRHLKTKETAIIPISITLYNTLKRYINLFNIEKYLFCDYNNEQMTENSFRQSIRNYCKQRGVPYKGVHAFRHTFARMYILNGGDAFTLQKLLCHKNIAMTMRYVNLFGSDLHEKIRMFSPLDSMVQSNKVHKR